MFLTPDDLRELTDTPLKALQIQWLDRNGWEYAISRLGNPKVLRAYAEIRLGIVGSQPGKQVEPDFSHWGA